ncbi:sodium-independent sulfate anion transporter isoform X2 [Halyomorpha halys]|uniref:sodium-independent sulfate anion transporter isoform X2 n=1 Tax=Halyomorpha halys TaxID=286706 RepID=UPI0006D4CCA3|nr:sodium-independent sulfate anion transporter-like isoform X2 [Halyomorpha halys]
MPFILKNMPGDNLKGKTFIEKRIPIVSWLPKYNTEDLVADLIAGVTVGLTVMPQALAYAALAGLEPQYGLYSSFLGCFVYTVFGSCKDITIGPTALMSLMTYQQVYNRNEDYAVLLCFLSGCLMVLMAVLRLGVLVEFISQPVTVGFTTATSVIIVVSQIKGLLGLSFTSEGFVPTLMKIAENIHETKFWDTTLGLVCIAILLLLRKVKDLVVVDKRSPKQKRVIAKCLWLLSTSRNALVVVVCSFISFVLHNNNNGSVPYKMTGAVRSGIPAVQLPPFSTKIGNETVGFIEMVSGLGSSIILVPIIAVLGNVAIAKAFASGGSVDATQELLTLAGCNLLGSFVSSMPVTGSFSRSAVNHASGVRTPMGGVYTGVLLLLALGVLTPYFYYIPKASLAAVIICAVIFMIEYEVIKPMWKASRKDLVPMFTTFCVCLLIGVELGILIGVATNIALLLIYAARPDIYIEKSQENNGTEYTRVKPSSSIHFPGVEHFRTAVLQAAETNLPVVIDCTFMQTTDFTTAKSISVLLNEFYKRHQALFFFNVKPTLAAVLSPICTKHFVMISNNDELARALQDVHKNGISDEITQVSTELSDLTHRNKRPKGLELEEKCEEPLLTYCMKATMVSGNPSI